MRPQPALTLAAEVRLGLADPVQKTLPAKALYDDVGSALFDAITVLPEYGLTRADMRLLAECSPRVAELSRARLVVELGSGSGVKARVLLAGFPRETIYRPIDVSRAALDRCRMELSEFDVRPIESDFLHGLLTATAERDHGPVLAIFLGSNIGNFERDAIPSFLGRIREQLRRGDTFLLGADLVKPAEQLMLAYDDPAGVTAAFNRNLLARLNREFNANFCPRCFEHEVRWNAAQRRIEMHLRARSTQHVRIPALDLEIHLGPGETIWTESSHKFEVPELTDMAAEAGFKTVQVWVDREWPFAELLFRVV